MISNTFVVLLAFLALSGVYSNLTDFDCFERSDSGPGRAYFEAYAWDARNKTCTKFIFGGRLGNRNRFDTNEQCIQSCRDAVLRKQLNFNPTRRYSAVNRLHETFQIAVNLQAVTDGYFQIVAQPDGKVLSVAVKEDTANVEVQPSNGDEQQQWDIVPTGEKGYFRIKTRSRPAGHVEFLFLQVTDKDTTHVNLGRRDDSSSAQQWRFV